MSEDKSELDLDPIFAMEEILDKLKILDYE